MALDKKERLRLQNESQDLLMEMADVFPSEYRFTLVARNVNMDDGSEDVVIMNDAPDDALAALQRSKDKLEVTSS